MAVYFGVAVLDLSRIHRISGGLGGLRAETGVEPTDTSSLRSTGVKAAVRTVQVDSVQRRADWGEPGLRPFGATPDQLPQRSAPGR